MIGLGLVIVGVVPLGIVAATMNADWSMVAMTIVAVLVTYGARDLALGLLDTENSSAISTRTIHSDVARRADRVRSMAGLWRSVVPHHIPGRQFL